MKQITLSRKPSMLELATQGCILFLLFVTGYFLFVFNAFLWELREIGTLSVDPDIIFHIVGGMIIPLSVNLFLAIFANFTISNESARFLGSLAVEKGRSLIGILVVSISVAISWEIFEYAHAGDMFGLLEPSETLFAFRGFGEAVKDISFTVLGANMIYFLFQLPHLVLNLFTAIPILKAQSETEQKIQSSQ